MFSNYVRLKIFKKWVRQMKNRNIFLDVGEGVGNWAFHFINDFKKSLYLMFLKKPLKEYLK